MQLGMIGLGRMGANMVRRLMQASHECVVYNRHPEPVQELVKEGAIGAASLEDFIQRLVRPRVVWLMVPAGVVDEQLAALGPLLEGGDIVVDGGNSHYHSDIRRAKELKVGQVPSAVIDGSPACSASASAPGSVRTLPWLVRKAPVE